MARGERSAEQRDRLPATVHAIEAMPPGGRVRVLIMDQAG